MSLRTRIRQWLGINEIQEDLSHINQHITYVTQSQQISDTIARRIENLVQVSVAGIGHCVAKLDKNFAVDEQDPAKVAESKRLEALTIARLNAEAKAREPYNHG